MTDPWESLLKFERTRLEIIREFQPKADKAVALRDTRLRNSICGAAMDEENEAFRSAFGCHSNNNDYWFDLPTLASGKDNRGYPNGYDDFVVVDDTGAITQRHYKCFKKDRKPFAILVRPYWHSPNSKPVIAGVRVIHLPENTWLLEREPTACQTFLLLREGAI